MWLRGEVSPGSCRGPYTELRVAPAANASSLQTVLLLALMATLMSISICASFQG